MISIHLLRHILFGIVLALSLIVLAICGNLIRIIDNELGFALGDTGFLGYGVAIGVITFAVIIPVIVFEKMGKFTFTGLVAVELAWTGVLWIMWLAMGAQIAPFSFGGGQAGAVTAFSFLNWLILMGWFIALIVFGIRGNHWMSYIPDTQIHQTTGTGAGTGFGGAHKNDMEKGNTYPPQHTNAGGAYDPYNNQHQPTSAPTQA